ncbi:DMT family transporter [Arenicella sp. 4NH20-0111]|uniref:DMT family transporter n=1 Tax=Arenicella sp. 4NH20-0111 TaxID=3127648 RepID=UPI00333F2E24
MEQPQTALKGLVFALAGYASYSVHDAVVKALQDYSVFQILFFAMLFTYVPFSVARIAAGNQLSVTPKFPKLAFTRALLHVSSLGFAFSAFATLPLVEAYVLLFCTPLIISLLAVIFLGEQIALVRWGLILMGLVGVIVVLRPSIETIQIGHILALSCSFCSAASAIIARKIGSSENMATMILFPLLATIFVSGAALYFVYIPMPIEHLGMMFLVGALGLLGQYCILTGFRLAPAAYIAPMQYSQIVWAIIFGYLFFNESVDQWVIIGSLITIFSGIGMLLRERQVSSIRANLNTRNGRVVGAPLMKPKEAEKSDEWSN